MVQFVLAASVRIFVLSNDAIHNLRINQLPAPASLSASLAASTESSAALLRTTTTTIMMMIIITHGITKQRIQQSPRAQAPALAALSIEAYIALLSKSD